MKRVALIFATDSEGKLLLGKRRDSGRWTLPGGHLKEDEDPEVGAARELKEETGLEALDDVMELVDERELDGVKFFTFGCGVEGTPSGKEDPDQECGVWAFFDVSNGVPKEVADNLAGPKDKDENIVTDHFGLAKMQRIPGLPKLGVHSGDDVKLVDNAQQRNLHNKILQNHFNSDPPGTYDDEGGPKAVANHIINNTAGSVVSTREPGQITGFAHSNNSYKDVFGRRTRFSNHHGTSKTTDLATKHHENFHVMMSRVEQRHGYQARNHLAQNLWNAAAGPGFHMHYMQASTGSDYHPDDLNEEYLALLHNYLNDPAERQSYHDTYKHTDDRRRYMHKQMKQAMKRVVDASKIANEEWLKPHPFMWARQQINKPSTPQFAAPPVDALSERKPPKRAGEIQMQKTEEDEVMRMLALPNRDERKMALKLATVNDKHLLRAFYDEDPEVRHAALNHPAMSHESLMGLMHMPQSENLKLLAMNHPLFNREHLAALYDAHASNLPPAIQDAIIAHDKLYPELISRMHENGHATRALIARADTPEHVIRNTIEKHFIPGADQRGPHRYLVIEALKHAHAPSDLVEKALREGDEGLKFAAVASPGMPKNAAEDILKQGHVKAGNPMIRAALVRSPFATERHLDLGVNDLHPLVRAAVFQTKSPLLNSKHVDRAIELGHLHDIVMALKSPAATQEHIHKLAQHKNPEISKLYTSYANKSALKKWEAGLNQWKNNSLTKSNLFKDDVNSEIVHDMLGYNHHLMSTFDAAKFLIAGHTPTLDQARKALWEHDGDAEKAALAAHGLDVSEGNLRALRAVRDLRHHKKNEPVVATAQSVVAGTPEAQKAAESVERAFKDRFVFPVKLGGKHSDGSLLARDTSGSETYLLKPGSGGISPAAGDHDDPVSQSRREAVFWHVADYWGLGDYLPETNLVIVDGHEYACMKLLPWKYKTLDKLNKNDSSVGQKVLAPYLKSGTLHKWAVLDYVLGNPDRHANNVMADATGDTPQADVKLIDHGSALAGDNFDPANDQNSFVPYYLRAWVIGPFNTLTVEQKLKVMPRVDDHVADELHAWVSELHAHELQAHLLRYGVDPEPSLARLAKLKMLISEQPVDLAINRLWVTT